MLCWMGGGRRVVEGADPYKDGRGRWRRLPRRRCRLAMTEHYRTFGVIEKERSDCGDLKRDCHASVRTGVAMTEEVRGCGRRASDCRPYDVDGGAGEGVGPRAFALPAADEAKAQRVQRSARCKPTPLGAASAGHRKRTNLVCSRSGRAQDPPLHFSGVYSFVQPQYPVACQISSRFFGILVHHFPLRTSNFYVILIPIDE